MMHKNRELDLKLNETLSKMRDLVQEFENKIPEEEAKGVAYSFIEIIKNINFPSDVSAIVVNPKIFSHVLLHRFRSRIFKSRSYPHFCFGLIDKCDLIVAHGYLMDEEIKRLVMSWLQYVKYASRDKRVKGYCEELINLISKARSTIWSPGTRTELIYGLEKGKEVYVVTNLKDLKLNKISYIKDMDLQISTVPFDRYGLRLYNKVWRPIISNIYSTLDELHYQKLMLAEL